MPCNFLQGIFFILGVVAKLRASYQNQESNLFENYDVMIGTNYFLPLEGGGLTCLPSACRRHGRQGRG